jgi:phosphohistidine swiveling domain-containing protein
MFDIDIYEYDEKRDGDRCWLSGALWAFPPWPPLMRQWLDGTAYGIWRAYDMWDVPGTHGWDVRVKDGVFYITSLLVESEEERKEREKRFLAKTAKVREDPFEFWNSYKPQLQETIDQLFSFDVEKAINADLADHIYDCVDGTRRMSTKIHYYAMAVLGALAFYFRDILAKYTGILPSDTKFSKLVSGSDAMVYKANKEIGKLATRAMKLGLRELFETLEPEEVLPELEKSDNGRKWSLEFNEFMKVYGRRTQIHGLYKPSWFEKPAIPILEVRRMMAMGGIYAPDLKREELVKDRNEIEKEVLSMIPEGERPLFKELLRCAQGWSYFNEDHIYYCEFAFFSLLRRAGIEAGKRLVKEGIFDEPIDAIYLYPVELQIALHPYGNKSGTRNILKKRKEEYNRYLKAEHPPVLGDGSKFAEMVHYDPILAIGIAFPIGNPEEMGATLVGGAGAPGVVEGLARVIMSVDEIGQIQPGEILVAPATSPQWVTVFGIIKGVVTDLGGPLAHTVLVAREYGMPCVVATMEATKKIRTGQRIKVDGNSLLVYLLD